MLLLHSSSTCWAVAVNDYGAIISTLLALSTFASLFFLAYVLHKTLSSRTPQNRLRLQQNAEKQRRKKRRPQGSHARSAKGGGRLRTITQQRKEGETLDENEHAFVNSTDEVRLRSDDTIAHTLPSLAEDKPVMSPSISPIHTSPTSSTAAEPRRDESLLLPS